LRLWGQEMDAVLVGVGVKAAGALWVPRDALETPGVCA